MPEQIWSRGPESSTITPFRFIPSSLFVCAARSFVLIKDKIEDDLENNHSSVGGKEPPGGSTQNILGSIGSYVEKTGTELKNYWSVIVFLLITGYFAWATQYFIERNGECNFPTTWGGFLIKNINIPCPAT